MFLDQKKMTAPANGSDHLIKIHYNDRTVNLTPDRLLDIRWLDHHGINYPGPSALENKNKVYLIVKYLDCYPQILLL